MKPIDIVNVLKSQDPQLFGKLPDKKAVQIVRSALDYIGSEIQKAGDGTLTVAGLGAFRVTTVEREKEGKKETVKRVIFKRPAKDKPGQSA